MISVPCLMELFYVVGDLSGVSLGCWFKQSQFCGSIRASSFAVICTIKAGTLWLPCNASWLCPRRRPFYYALWAFNKARLNAFVRKRGVQQSAWMGMLIISETNASVLASASIQEEYIVVLLVAWCTILGLDLCCQLLVSLSVIEIVVRLLIFSCFWNGCLELWL